DLQERDVLGRHCCPLSWICKGGLANAKPRKSFLPRKGGEGPGRHHAPTAPRRRTSQFPHMRQTCNKGEGVASSVWHHRASPTGRHLPPCGGGWEGGAARATHSTFAPRSFFFPALRNTWLKPES